MAEKLSPAPSSSHAVGERSNILHCFVCMEPPNKPVAGVCGHVFCWSCLHQWLADGPKPCPMCRHTLDKDQNIICLYGSVESANEENVKLPPSPPNLMLYLDSITNQGTSSADTTSSAFYRERILDLFDAHYEQSVALEEKTNRVQYLEREQGILEQHIQYMGTKLEENWAEKWMDARRIEALERENAEMREQSSRMFDLQMEKGNLELYVQDLEQKNMHLLLAKYEEAERVKTLQSEQTAVQMEKGSLELQVKDLTDKVLALQMEKGGLDLQMRDLGRKNMDLLITKYEEVKSVKILLGEEKGKVFDLEMEQNEYRLQVEALQRQNLEFALARDREARCVKALQAQISLLVKESNQVGGNGVEGSALQLAGNLELYMARNSVKVERANNLQEAQCCEDKTYLAVLCNGLDRNPF